MSRSDGDGLLAAIAESPGDDTPRLVYADWLDEYGDHVGAMRAKFIRLQVARAREGVTARPSRKEAILLDLFARKWHPDWPAAWHGVVRYERGFPDHARLDWPAGEELLLSRDPELAALRSLSLHGSLPERPGLSNGTVARIAAAVAGRAPLARLRVEGGIGQSREFWGRVGWGAVADLGVSDTDTGEAESTLAAVCSRPWPNVRRLEIDTFLARNWPDPVLGGAAFPAVTDLAVRHTSDFAAVAGSPLARRVRRLEIATSNEADEAVSRALAPVLAGGVLPDLAELHLRSAGADPATLARTLADLPAGRLTLLALGRPLYGPAGLDSPNPIALTVAASPALATLDHLDLAEFRFSPLATRGLIEAAADAGVRRLAVLLPHADADFARFLLESPALDRFERFRIADSDHGDHLPEPLRLLARRLGHRAAFGDLTADYFAAARRWRPL